jgi:8-oxo-dGTP diphosphatase
MDVFLIRHAHAGSRTFGVQDKYRQLSEEGRRQADQLAEYLGSMEFGAAYSSPAVRCAQTLQPAATAAGLTVVEHDGLWEEAGIDQMLAVIDLACQAVGDDNVVALCSHGNLIPGVIERLAYQGVPVVGRGCERASIWRLRRRRGEWAEARYLTPRSAYEP